MYFFPVPVVVDAPKLYDINRTANEIEIVLQRPQLENGTIDMYYIVVKVTKEFLPKQRKKRFSDGASIEEILNDNIENEDKKSDIYIALSLQHDQIFHLTTPLKHSHNVIIGSGETEGSFTNKKLQSTLYYQIKTLACIRVCNLFFLI